MRMGSSSCLPAREGAVVMLHSLLCFLSSRLDECTGNGEPGVMGCTATAGRLRLGPLGLKNDALGLPSALLARDRDNQLFLGLGQRQVWAETARGTFDCLDFGDGRDYLVDGSCSRRRQLERTCRTSRILLVRTRLPSVYPLGDRSRSQVFVDEGEIDCLARSYRGALVVARR
jgi:hypothetical protein